MLRTHTCGELTDKDSGKNVTLCGWVASLRDHGGKTFLDLRDRYGTTQIVLGSNKEKLGREDCIQIKGKVQKRKPGNENKNIKTGKIEIKAIQVIILNKSKIPPIEVEDRIEANDELRLKYRYLDLRRPIMTKRLIKRHEAMQVVREYLSSKGFLEIETPLLVRQTPEGARDYLVPSRVNPGKMYALPQSPQLYKQILMVSGMDRYFQLARCLRDEDLRADRQPEFTQIDLEMSFGEEEDLFLIMDEMFKQLFKKVINMNLKTPFPRMSHNDAMERFGSDKPDLRFGMELMDVTQICKKTDFNIFKQAERITMLSVPKEFSRNEIETLTKLAQVEGVGGLGFAKVVEGKLDSGISKFLDPNIQKQLIKKSGPKNKDTLFFVADKKNVSLKSSGALRLEFGKQLNLIDKKEFKFCWITDFPLFEWNEDTQQLEPAHHIFTMPKVEDVKYLKTDPGRVHARCYDFVLNGVELASGSVRNHDPKIQKEVLSVIGVTEKEAERKFGFLLEALQYGGPPHLGIAFGFDRIVALMNGINDIREVIAFPKNKKAESPMDGSPSLVEDELLKDLNLEFRKDD